MRFLTAASKRLTLMPHSLPLLSFRRQNILPTPLSLYPDYRAFLMSTFPPAPPPALLPSFIFNDTYVDLICITFPPHFVIILFLFGFPFSTFLTPVPPYRGLYISNSVFVRTYSDSNIVVLQRAAGADVAAAARGVRRRWRLCLVRRVDGRVRGARVVLRTRHAPAVKRAAELAYLNKKAGDGGGVG
jgi:hypothetical protein